MENEQLAHLSLEKIICRKQVREQFDEGSIDGLAATLDSVGQLQPIRVCREGEQFVVVDGERRLRAARKMGLGTIAAVVDDKPLTLLEILERQLVANAQRADLKPLEQARAIDRILKETGISAQEAATRLGTSPASISRLLSLLTLPESILKDLEEGSISPSTGYALAKIKDPVKQEELAKEAASGKLTRDDAARAARKEKQPRSKSPASRAKKASIELGGGRTITIAGDRLDFEGFIEACESALAKAKKARNQAMSFGTFLKVARDQAQV